MTPITTAFFVPDARRHFFASKNEFLAFKAAWRAATASELKLPAPFYAAHAVLTGRDLYRAFSPNRRRGESDPYSALVRAIRTLQRLAQPKFSISGYWLAEFHRVLTADQASILTSAFEQAGNVLRTFELRKDEVVQAIANGEGRFPARESSQVA